MASSRKRNGDVLDGNRNRTNPGDLDGIYEINERKIQGKKKSSPSALINIFIKNLEGKITYYLEVEPSDTIGNVKAKMSDFAHVLVFNGVALEDSSTLVGLNIIDRSILTRIDMAPHGKMEIFVHTFAKKTISLLVTSTDTIANVKLWIMYKERVPVDEQVLTFNGMALGDGGIHCDFDIHEKSALTLVRRPRGLMKIFVKTFGGKVITVKVNPSNTIGDVKSKIQGEVEVPYDEQELIFDDTVLDHLNTVANCNINEESTLTLVRISTGYMHISIYGQDGNTTFVRVKPSTTVDKVKSKYTNIKVYPEDSMKFFFDGRHLKEDLTLADCHVPNGSTIEAMIHQTGD